MEKLYLSPYIRVVKGGKQSSVIDYKEGLFFLVPHRAAEMLKMFTEGQVLNDILNKDDQTSFRPFIEKAKELGILAHENIIVEKGPSSLNVLLELTDICNLKCRHCFNESDNKKSDNLTMDDINKVYSYRNHSAKINNPILPLFKGKYSIKLILLIFPSGVHN